MVIIAFACWQLFAQTEQREERQHAAADMSSTPPCLEKTRSEPDSPASALPPRGALDVPASLRPGAVAQSATWKQRLKGRALKAIKLSIQKKREVPATSNPASRAPMK
jgi:hypothetical protein